MLKISIIIPVYKVEKYVEICINSVISQTYKGKIECIIVDDCSPVPDRSWEVVERVVNGYKGENIEFVLVNRIQNGGLSAARNSGIDVMTGDYAYFLDSDDYITPDCIEKLCSYAEQYPNIDMVASDFMTSCNGKFGSSLFPNRKNDGYYNGDLACYSMICDRSTFMVSAWNKLIRRDKVLINRFKEGLLYEDLHWYYRIGRDTNSLYISKDVTYVYLINRAGSIMNDTNKLGKSFSNMLSIIEEFINSIEPQYATIQRRYILQNIITEYLYGSQFDINYINSLKLLMRKLALNCSFFSHVLIRLMIIMPISIFKKKVVYNFYYKNLKL